MVNYDSARGAYPAIGGNCDVRNGGDRDYWRCPPMASARRETASAISSGQSSCRKCLAGNKIGSSMPAAQSAPGVVEVRRTLGETQPRQVHGNAAQTPARHGSHHLAVKIGRRGYPVHAHHRLGIRGTGIECEGAHPGGGELSARCPVPGQQLLDGKRHLSCGSVHLSLSRTGQYIVARCAPSDVTPGAVAGLVSSRSGTKCRRRRSGWRPLGPS